MRLNHWVHSAVLLAACGGGADDSGGPPCDPARGPRFARFMDATRASGIDFQYETGGFQGAGLAVIDLDGDGLPEIVAGQRAGGVRMFRNRGSLRFEEVTDAGIDAALATTAIGAADLDNDGDRDLVLAGPGSAVVLANQGDGSFREALRLPSSGMTEHVLPTDLDGDGQLDLYFSNYDLRGGETTQNRLYLNRGGLDIAFAGTVGSGLSWTATTFDFDADGDQDVYVANDTLLPDFGIPGAIVTPQWPVDLMLRNDGPGPDGVPRFTDVAVDVGLAKPRSSMGGLLGDFDDDGRVDLYVPDFGANKLFVRDPAGGYVDRAAELGIVATSRHHALCGPGSPSEACLVLSWTAALVDFDLDGYDELLVINGETSPGDLPPVVLFTRGAELPYREVSSEIPCMDARGLVVTDLDADGDQDVVIAHKLGPLAIYENRGTPAPGTWLHVTLRGTRSNRDGVGAVVTMRLASGRTVIRVVGHGGVIHTASPAEAYFGVGTDDVLAIEVLWPSGRRTELIRPLPGTSVVVEEGP